ncbi:MAG: ACT domain-containing protein [Oscillospiraceae bacterium]|nr:ACT domain-containing protein [Oscillospiraceae bacterium]
MKAIVTVVGKDRVGIIASVCVDLAKYNVNVLDIRQTVMQGYFTMMMVTDVSESTCPLAELAQKLEEKGKEMNLSIRLQREEIFQAMHRV